MYQAKTTWPTPWGFYLIVLFGVTLDVAYESQTQVYVLSYGTDKYGSQPSALFYFFYFYV